MGGIFEPIRLDWQGKTYTIPPDRMMRTLQALEADGFSLATIGQMRGSMSMARCSRAFALLLRLAGCHGVTDEDVYQGMVSSIVDDESGEGLALMVNAALGTLEAVFIPTSMTKKKPPPKSKKKARKKGSSKKRTSSA